MGGPRSLFGVAPLLGADRKTRFVAGVEDE
jgi:hypothetical protein